MDTHTHTYTQRGFFLLFSFWHLHDGWLSNTHFMSWAFIWIHSIHNQIYLGRVWMCVLGVCVCVYARACVNWMWERKNWVATEKQQGADFFFKRFWFFLSEIHNLPFIRNHWDFQMKKRALIKFRMFSARCIQTVPQVNGEPQVSVKACGWGSMWPKQFEMKGFCKLT